MSLMSLTAGDSGFKTARSTMKVANRSFSVITTLSDTRVSCVVSLNCCIRRYILTAVVPATRTAGTDRQTDNLCSRNLTRYFIQTEEKETFLTTETKIILGRYYPVYSCTLTIAVGNSVNVSWFSSAFPVERHICHQIIMHRAYKLPVLTTGN